MVYGLGLLYTNPEVAGEKTSLQRAKAGHFHLRQHRDTDPSVLVIKDTEQGELGFYYFLELENLWLLKEATFLWHFCWIGFEHK